MSSPREFPVNDADTVRREYATEDSFLCRRLAHWAELRGPLMEDAAIAALAEVAPRGVLDVGCGTGDFSERVLRELGVDLAALDFSHRMAALARGRGLAAVRGDIEALPFPDGAFDCVLANRVLYHLPDLDCGLVEIRRVLRSGGRLVALTYSTEHCRELWEIVGDSAHVLGPFSTESGLADLRPHFDCVERRDITGIARFPDTQSLLSMVTASLGAAWAGESVNPDAEARIRAIPTPFETVYRHSVFVADRDT